MTARTAPLTGDFVDTAELLDAAAVRHGDRDAYVEPGRSRLSFADWARASDGLAATLAERGVGRGDVVALMLPSSIDFAICYAALARLGAITTALNPRLGPREVHAVLDQARPALVIRDPATGLPEPLGAVPVLPRSALAPAYRAAGPRRRPELSLADPVVLIWTSGTTGVPKGAWFDSANLAASAEASGVMSAPYDRRLVATPFAHAGYLAKLWDQLVWGTTVVISPTPWSAGAMAEILRGERITVAGGVPTQWAKLLELPGIGGLPDLRVGVVASAPAAPELVERTAALIGVPLVVRYAMTESPTISGTEPDDPPEVRFRTVGRPQAGMAVVVADDAGNPLAVGEVGRLRVRGGCVMRGYWQRPDLTAEAITADGWLLTGDYGYLTPEGNLVLSGRASDVYIRGGFNIYPLEVERVLGEHPGVAKAAVVGASAPVIGEVGVAFVVPADIDRPPSLAGLRGWCKARLADYKAPDHLEIVEDLPLNAMQKLDRAALRTAAEKSVSAGE
jgi:acyl-CoA synthetase (AMP-forming)/AMP-acid ligase II